MALPPGSKRAALLGMLGGGGAPGHHPGAPGHYGPPPGSVGAPPSSMASAVLAPPGSKREMAKNVAKGVLGPEVSLQVGQAVNGVVMGAVTTAATAAVATALHHPPGMGGGGVAPAPHGGADGTMGSALAPPGSKRAAVKNFLKAKLTGGGDHPAEAEPSPGGYVAYPPPGPAPAYPPAQPPAGYPPGGTYP